MPLPADVIEEDYPSSENAATLGRMFRSWLKRQAAVGAYSIESGCQKKHKKEPTAAKNPSTSLLELQLQGNTASVFRSGGGSGNPGHARITGRFALR